MLACCRMLSDQTPSHPGWEKSFVLNESEISDHFFDTLEYTAVERGCGPMRLCYGRSYLRHRDKNKRNVTKKKKKKLSTHWFSKSWLVRTRTRWIQYVRLYTLWFLTAARAGHWSPRDLPGLRPPPAGSWWSPWQPRHYWGCWSPARPWCHRYRCVNCHLQIGDHIVNRFKSNTDKSMIKSTRVQHAQLWCTVQ